MGEQAAGRPQLAWYLVVLVIVRLTYGLLRASVVVIRRKDRFAPDSTRKCPFPPLSPEGDPAPCWGLVGPGGGPAAAAHRRQPRPEPGRGVALGPGHTGPGLVPQALYIVWYSATTNDPTSSSLARLAGLLGPRLLAGFTNWLYNSIFNQPISSLAFFYLILFAFVTGLTGLALLTNSLFCRRGPHYLAMLGMWGAPQNPIS